MPTRGIPFSNSHFFNGLEIVATHDVTAHDSRSVTDACTNSDETIFQARRLMMQPSEMIVFQRGPTDLAGVTFFALVYIALLLSKRLKSGISLVRPRLASKKE
jgi:hypothetical protein